MHQFVQQLIANLRETSLLEFIAVIFGIISVWFSRKENIWVYPTGLVSTVPYVYISLKGQLIGEASVNFYYTVMSLYGWWLWAKKDTSKNPLVHVTHSNKKDWLQQLLFFAAFYASLFFALSYLKQSFYKNAIPWADAFASATAYTGMWLMAKKKVESWYWWIATNLASVPLYYAKGFAFTSLYYVVLFMMAIWGLKEWQRRGKAPGNAAIFAFEST